MEIRITPLDRKSPAQSHVDGICKIGKNVWLTKQGPAFAAAYRDTSVPEFFAETSGYSTPQGLEYNLNLGKRYWVAEVAVGSSIAKEGTVLGFIAMSCKHDPGYAPGEKKDKISILHADPLMQRSGVGAALYYAAATFSKAHNVGAIFLDSVIHDPTLKFYERKLGFTVAGDIETEMESLLDPSIRVKVPLRRMEKRLI
jgi:GNAT superfamily N-acetyltransferase